MQTCNKVIGKIIGKPREKGPQTSDGQCKGFRIQGRQRIEQNGRGKEVSTDKDRLQLVPEGELSLDVWKGRG